MLGTFERLYEEFRKTQPNAYKFANIKEVETRLSQIPEAIPLLAKAIYPIQELLVRFCFTIVNDENYSKVMKPAHFRISSDYRTNSPSHRSYTAFDITADNIPQIYYFFTYMRMYMQKTKAPFFAAISLHNWHIHVQIKDSRTGSPFVELKSSSGVYSFVPFTYSYQQQLREKYQCKTGDDILDNLKNYLPSPVGIFSFLLLLLASLYFLKKLLRG